MCYPSHSTMGKSLFNMSVLGSNQKRISILIIHIHHGSVKEMKAGDRNKTDKESHRPQLSGERNNYVRAKLTAAKAVKT